MSFDQFTPVQILCKSYTISYKTLNVVLRFSIGFTSISFLYLTKTSLLKWDNFRVIYFLNYRYSFYQEYHNNFKQSEFLKAANKMTMMLCCITKWLMLCCRGHYKVVLCPPVYIRIYTKQITKNLVISKAMEIAYLILILTVFYYLSSLPLQAPLPSAIFP